MLGSVVEAEDILQKAWIRWQFNSTIVKSPKAFLCRITTRLCIDRLRYLHRERKKYVGLWLPEPPIDRNNLEASESISYAFSVLLECLSPVERAVFILREVFDYKYQEIATIVDKKIPNCRQIYHRARENILTARSKFDLFDRQQDIAIEQFLIAWNRGDLNKLLSLIVKDITLYPDGGGKTTTAQKLLCGNLKVARFLLVLK